MNPQKTIAPSLSNVSSIRSGLFHLNNETVNIYTHLVPATIFFLLFLSLLAGTYPTSTWMQPATNLTDVLVVSLYTFTVSICFAASTLFHIFSNHSSNVHSCFNAIDHLGIIAAIWGSAIPAAHFTFHSRLQNSDHHRHHHQISQPDTIIQNPHSYTPAYIYHALFTLLAFASATTSIGLQRKTNFQQPHHRLTRTLLFSSLGASCFLPVLHGLYIYRNGDKGAYNEMNVRMGLTNFLGLAVCHSIGGMIYIARIPERWFPRVFDVVGSSHQLMHVMVVCGAVVYLKGLVCVLGNLG